MTSPINREKVKAGELADCLFQVCSEESPEKEVAHFWKRLAGRMWDRLSAKDKSDLAFEASKPEPMTDKDAARFSRIVMEFGQYKGQEMRDVPLKYLDWYVGETETFAKQVRQYLHNPTVAEKLKRDLDNT